MWNNIYISIMNNWLFYIFALFAAGVIVLIWFCSGKRSREVKISGGGSDTEDTNVLQNLISGLGGLDNIYDLRSTDTRLRVVVNNGTLVDRQMIRKTGATGVLGKNRDVQIFYNTGVEQIRTELTNYVKRAREYEGLEEEDIEIENESVIEKIYAPVEGDIICLERIHDYETLGDEDRDGIAIFPKRGEVRAPFDGEIRAIQRTGNKIIITSKNNISLLIHMGRCPEQLHGEAFHIYVNEGDVVRKGRLLAEINLEMVMSCGYDATVFATILNLKEAQRYKAYVHENVNFEYVVMKVFAGKTDCP